MYGATCFAGHPRGNRPVPVDQSVGQNNPTDRKARHMSNQNDHLSPNVDRRTAAAEDDLQAHWQQVVGRRSFLRGVEIAGAVAIPGSAVFTSAANAAGRLNGGDVAILRFLAAAS